MDVIRVAHISDLHFGSEGQTPVWNLLRDYLNDTIKPNLILVTGDIAHTPDKELFSKAENELSLLRVVRPNPKDAYRVCAGNHDRHPLGNAPGKLAPVVNYIRGWRGASSWFDQAFSGVSPTVKNPEKLELEVGNNHWTLRIIGCDTSKHAEYTALGFASEYDLANLAAAARGDPEADLVILMHHHHLLSIWELEQSRQRLKDVFKPTIMLNAGTMLEALARGHVNIVLHGHEHFKAYAKYGTVQGQHSETVIVGAGSATGNDSAKGCEIRRASFNLLELRRDRSVFLQEYGNNGIKWDIVGSPIQLLDGRAIRRGRFYRSTAPDTPPTSKIIKYFEFKSDRTVEITQTWTDWTLEEGRWTHLTHNSSGVPSPARVDFVWRHDAPQSFEAEFFPVGRDHAYRAEIDTGQRTRRFARQITVRFKWLGGALLTKGDLDFLERSKVGEFRSGSKEFAGIQVYNELQLLSLLVRLPKSYAPQNEADVEVFYAEAGRQNSDDLEPSQELTVQHHAPGVFSLEVPYPRKGYQYLLTWPISERAQRTNGAEQFSRVAGDKNKGVQLLNAFSNVLGRAPSLATRSLGLYVGGEAPGLLRRVAQMAAGGMEVPSQLSLIESNSLHRHAWWGTIQLAVADESNEPAFMQGEKALVLVPIRPFGIVDDLSWGLVRVGIYNGAGTSDDSLFNLLNDRATLEIFADGVLMMLQKAIELR